MPNFAGIDSSGRNKDGGRLNLRAKADGECSVATLWSRCCEPGCSVTSLN